MAEALLRTKLTIPPGRVDLVKRVRLFNDLEAGLQLPLTMVIAPAGSGKTSLLRAWKSSDTGRDAPVAWLALDEDDNGPLRFWQYIVAALETCAPVVGDATRAYLASTQHGAIQASVTALINDLVERQVSCVLVIDDYHLINNEDIHTTFAFLIENIPPQVHVVLISRHDPPLPLARWRARGIMAELRINELRFTTDEALVLLGVGSDSSLTVEQAEALTRRTEGWAAGLHLAELALRNRENVAGFVETFTGSHHFVLTYLIDEVLSRQPESVQQFLIETSILGHLSPPLCNAVTQRDDAFSILARLEAENLFIMPLDESGYWYRYHHLFADVLQHRLQRAGSDQARALHQRAASWYEGNGMNLKAIDHFSKSGDYDAAIRLIKVSAPKRGTASEAEMVERCLAHLPDEIIRADPVLGLIGAWSQLVTGPLDEIEDWLGPVEEAADDDATYGEAAAIRAMAASFSGDVSEAISRAEEALNNLPDHDVSLRGIIAMSLGQAHRFEGNLEESFDAYHQAVELGLQSDNLYAAIDSLSDLGLVLMRLGRLHEADRAFQRAQQELSRRNAEDLPVAGSLAVIWPDLLRERNQLTAALELLHRGIELGRRGSKMDLLITGYRGLASVLWVQGQWDDAYTALSQSRNLASEYGLEHTVRGIDVREVQIRLAQGDLPAAQEWLRSIRPDDRLPGSVREAEQLMMARVQVASGASGQALEMIAPLRAAADRDRRVGDLIAILVVDALGHQALGDLDGALGTIGRALELAATQGFVRVFLDEGEPMIELLHRSAKHGTGREYARCLIAEFGNSEEGERPRIRAMDPGIEPLSAREQAVLRLLHAGMTAPEIAIEMFVAPSTVRTHLKSIYRKLDVHSRDQALTKARELDIL